MTAAIPPDRAIASRLAEVTTSAAIRALMEETEAALTEAEQRAAIEQANALDPARSPDAAAARETMVAAEFTVERLRRLLPRLEERRAALVAAEQLASWHREAEPLARAREVVVAELTSTYPRLVNELIDLLTRAQQIDEKIARLGTSPFDEHRRASGVPLTGVATLAAQLKLPEWGGSQQWPRPGLPMVALLAPVPGGDPRLTTPEWWKVKQEEANTVRTARQREAAQAEDDALARTIAQGTPVWWRRSSQ